MTGFSKEYLNRVFVLKPGINEEVFEWVKILSYKIEALLEGKPNSRRLYDEGLEFFVKHRVGEVGGPSDLATGAVEGNDPYIKSIELGTDIALATFEFAHRVTPYAVASDQGSQRSI